MFHEVKFGKGYYDTVEEIPNTATVRFPGGEKKQLTEEEMLKLSEDGWFTVLHSSNIGICDHWTSVKLAFWVEKRFKRILNIRNQDGDHLGYRREEDYVQLTKESNVFHAEVWNS